MTDPVQIKDAAEMLPDISKIVGGGGGTLGILTFAWYSLRDRFKREDEEQVAIKAAVADIDKRVGAVEVRSEEHAGIRSDVTDLDKRVGAVEAKAESLDKLLEEVADLKALHGDVKRLVKEMGEARASELALVREIQGMNMRFVRLEMALYIKMGLDMHNLPQTGGDTFIPRGGN